ncbi:TPA: hypothetical protein I7290_23790 [Vibrio parahaemolyticus]|nr:hypothetical protein [Vibrio parahaemolyticus]
MDWMTFVTSLSGHLAWPITVLIVVVLLKKNIEQIFPRLESFKHNKTEISFSKAVSEVVEKAKHVENDGEPLPSDLKSEETRLISKIDIAPVAVVQQAWALLDRELLEVYDEYLNKGNRKLLTVRIGHEILKSIGFNEELTSNISKLSQIRKATYGIKSYSESNLTTKQVESYVELALDCTAKVREFVS